MDAALPTLIKAKHKLASSQQKREFKLGDEVKVMTFNQNGHLVEKIGKDEWEVQLGIMKMKVKEKDMEFIKSEQKKETKPLATIKGKDYHVGLELDLTG